MATLFVRKVGSRGAKLLTLGGEPGDWEVTDGEVVLATARARLAHDQLDIDAKGRRLTARMPGITWSGDPDKLEVVDQTTGQKVIDGKRTSGRLQNQEWSVILPTGAAISWMYRTDPQRLGFYETSGAPIMLMGHDPSFQTPAKGGTLRILLRFWGSAIASADRYVARVEDGAIGNAVTAEEVPVLALLGMWLQRKAEGYADAGGMSA